MRNLPSMFQIDVTCNPVILMQPLTNVHTHILSVWCNRSGTKIEQSLPNMDYIHDLCPHTNHNPHNLNATLYWYTDTQVCNATDQLQTLRNLFPSQIAFMIHPNTKPQSLKSRQKILVLHCYIKHLMQQIRYKCWEISSKQTLHSWSVYAPDHDLWNLDTTLDWYTPICQACDNATD